MARMTIAILEAEVVDCTVEIYLNRIPLTVLSPSGCRAVALPVVQYLTRGQNQLMMAVNPGSTPGTSMTGPSWTTPRSARARARLATYPPGVFPGDATGLEHLALYWTGDEQDGETRQVVGTVDWPPDTWPSSAGTWAWESASVLNPTEDVNAVMQLIERVHQALSAGDTAFMVDLGNTLLQEIAVAYSLDFNQERQDVWNLFQQEFARPDWGMEPLDPEAYDMRFCAGGRLVECVATDREPILRARPDAEENQFSYPMLVGAVDGQLRVLR